MKCGMRAAHHDLHGWGERLENNRRNLSGPQGKFSSEVLSSMCKHTEVHKDLFPGTFQQGRTFSEIIHKHSFLPLTSFMSWLLLRRSNEINTRQERTKFSALVRNRIVLSSKTRCESLWTHWPGCTSIWGLSSRASLCERRMWQESAWGPQRARPQSGQAPSDLPQPTGTTGDETVCLLFLTRV